jgi:HSP20 family protein
MNTALTTQQNGNLAESQDARSWASPPVDVYEGSNEYLVVADVPGVNKDDINLEFSSGELRIRASRQIPDAEWAADYRRTFTIGQDVDVEKISAEYSNGVLQVHLPKLESVKPRQITVQSA